MSARVVIVGAGVAGTAAALAAAKAGAMVTLVDGGTGASTLATGAIDVEPWDRAAPPGVSAVSPDRDLGVSGDRIPERLPDDARAILEDLGAYAFGGAPVLLATTGGIVRPARGADRALLDLSRLGAGVVVVPRAEHGGWDAAALARAWMDSSGRSFVADAAQLTRYTDEFFLPHADVAARHDDPERLRWLAERLRETLARSANVAGVILPPWLGAEKSRAAALSEMVGVPCGEALAAPGGPAGLRFERARDRATVRAGVRVVRGRVRSAAHAEGEWRLEVADTETLGAERVVLAAGGLVGGGFDYSPSESVLAGPLPSNPRSTFTLSFDAPVQLGAHARTLALPGTMFGVAPESLAWPFTDDPLLERAGVLNDAGGRARGAPEGLFVAGDLAADRPRTWLGALASGAAAGRAAAGSAI
jgi:glycerol-3-phosphate dehydrogenase subunit B